MRADCSAVFRSPCPRPVAPGQAHPGEGALGAAEGTASSLRRVGRAEPERPEWPLGLGRVEGRSAASPRGRTTRARRARGSAEKPDRRAGTGRPVNAVGRKPGASRTAHLLGLRNSQSDRGRTPPWPAAPSLCAGRATDFSKPGAGGRRLRSTSQAPGSGGQIAGQTVRAGASQLASLERADPAFSLCFPFPPGTGWLTGTSEEARGTRGACGRQRRPSGCRFQSPRGGEGAEIVESQSRGALVQCVNQPKVPGGKHVAWGLLWACPLPRLPEATVYDVHRSNLG